jgi:hypothetical protein
MEVEEGPVCEECGHDHEHGEPLTDEEFAARRAAFIEKTKEKIKEHGWIVQGVMASQTTPEWAYSVGLRNWDHPEVVIVNLPMKIAHGVINEIGDRVKAGEKFECDRMYDKLIANYAVIFREVPDPEEGDWFNVAGWVYGSKDWPVIQCFWPDMEGHFPWQEGYDIRYMQPHVGVDD